MAGTTTATAYVKPSAWRSVDSRTGAVAFLPVRVLAGSYMGVGITSNKKGLRSFLPDMTVSPVDKDGNWNPRWYLFFDQLVNYDLDLNSKVTLGDIKLQLQVDQALALAAANHAALAQQQADTNAQVISATRDVVQAAALPGAAQIPIPKLALQDSTAGV
jgi:hypothetical protein